MRKQAKVSTNNTRAEFRGRGNRGGGRGGSSRGGGKRDYRNSGILFGNSYRKEENEPIFSGYLTDVENTKWRVGAWVNLGGDYRNDRDAQDFQADLADKLNDLLVEAFEEYGISIGLKLTEDEGKGGKGGGRRGGSSRRRRDDDEEEERPRRGSRRNRDEEEEEEEEEDNRFNDEEEEAQEEESEEEETSRPRSRRPAAKKAAKKAPARKPAKKATRSK